MLKSQNTVFLLPPARDFQIQSVNKGINNCPQLEDERTNLKEVNKSKSSDKEKRNKKSYDHDEAEITVGGGVAMLSWSVMVSCFLHLQNFTTNIPKNY